MGMLDVGEMKRLVFVKPFEFLAAMAALFGVMTFGILEGVKIAEAGRAQNIDFHLARVKPDVMDVLERDGALDAIGTDRIHDDIAAAFDEHERRHPVT